MLRRVLATLLYLWQKLQNEIKAANMFYYLNVHITKIMSQEHSKMVSSKPKEMATLGGGYFWCTEATFSEMKGVEKVESGYSGGTNFLKKKNN